MGMYRKLGTIAVVCALVAAVALWFASGSRPLSADEIPAHVADAAAGQRMFYAAGCASCHAAPDAKGDEMLRLTGGLALASPFGTFRALNISPDPTSGIGGWSALDFVNAVRNGIAPDGSHYYPAFPYASYARMRIEDILDLKAYMDTLPPVSSARVGHDLPFPFNIRRGVGLWKRLFVSAEPVVDGGGLSDQAIRGRYLVEGPGHCGECHTPRNMVGGLQFAAWLSGAANPEGDGTVPNITPHAEGIGAWSEEEIASYLEFGLSPDFEVVGGAMRAVQANMARLTPEDRKAIAAYLKAIPGLADSVRRPASR